LVCGDVVFGVVLIAINSLLCLLVLLVIFGFVLEYFLGAGQYVPPPVRKVVEVALIIVLPVALGMAIRAFAPQVALRAEKPVRLLSVLVLVLLIVAAVAQSLDVLLSYFALVGLACLLFNLASMGVGYAAPLALKLPRRQAIAISMEIGIHNGTLAIFIALNVLQDAAMSIPAAVYSLLMFFTAAAFAFWLNRGRTTEAASLQPPG
jgi:bile acid:Na+ symporter, BASS family